MVHKCTGLNIRDGILAQFLVPHFQTSGRAVRCLGNDYDGLRIQDETRKKGPRKRKYDKSSDQTQFPPSSLAYMLPATYPFMPAKIRNSFRSVFPLDGKNMR
jgi:hypothetical protein